VPGLAKINPQDGHIILEDLSEGHTSIHIYISNGRGRVVFNRKTLFKTVTGSRPY